MLGFLFLTEIADFGNAVRKAFPLSAQTRQIFLITCARFLKLLHIVLQLVKQGVVRVQLCAQLLQLRRLGVPQNADQFAAILG